MFISSTLEQKNTILITDKTMCATAKTAANSKCVDKIVAGIVTAEKTLKMLKIPLCSYGKSSYFYR